MTRDLLVEVLRHHQQRYGFRDMRVHCICGWVATDRETGPSQHINHQAGEITEALRLKGHSILRGYERLLTAMVEQDMDQA